MKVYLSILISLIGTSFLISCGGESTAPGGKSRLNVAGSSNEQLKVVFYDSSPAEMNITCNDLTPYHDSTHIQLNTFYFPEKPEGHGGGAQACAVNMTLKSKTLSLPYPNQNIDYHFNNDPLFENGAFVNQVLIPCGFYNYEVTRPQNLWAYGFRYSCIAKETKKMPERPSRYPY